MIPLELLCKGGEKVLLHFIQDSPGDHLPLEDISKALGISAEVKAGQRPVVRYPINIQESYKTFLILESLVMSETLHKSCIVKGSIK